MELFGFPYSWIKLQITRPSWDILDKEIREDNEELKRSIDRLSVLPKEGLLTIGGLLLPKEFRGYEGYIQKVRGQFDTQANRVYSNFLNLIA